MPFDIDDYRRAAQRRLPRSVFDYVDGGAGKERGLSRNRAALDSLVFRPRALTDVSRIDTSATLFGRRLELPILVAPMGMSGIVCPGADLILARAAGRNGVPFILSTASTTSLETLARSVEADLWFQLYVMQRDVAAMLVARAAASGYRTLVLTVDVPVGGRRLRDARNGFSIPFRMTPEFIWSCVRRPGWSLRQALHGTPQFANLASADASNFELQSALLQRRMDASFAWDDLGRLRDAWPHRLVVKGIQSPEDAARCIEAGADAVVFSNHGGRQLEDAPAPINVLAAMPGPADTPLLVDSGFRSGADVAKALALGADAVLVGRALLYGLAAAGEAGVQGVFDLFRAELENTLALLGCPRAGDLTRSHLG